jgi:hypothetical protein
VSGKCRREKEFNAYAPGEEWPTFAGPNRKGRPPEPSLRVKVAPPACFNKKCAALSLNQIVGRNKIEVYRLRDVPD